MSPVPPPAPTININAAVPSKMSAIVSDISVVAYHVAPQSRVNHWAVFLHIGPDESVMVDMIPVNMNNTGMIQFHHKNYDVSNRVDFRLKYPTINNPTVQQIYNILTTPDQANVRLDRYKFSPQGNGCAFWTVTFLTKMETLGYLAQGTAAQVWGYMQYYYIGNVAQGPVEVQGERQGTFY